MEQSKVSGGDRRQERGEEQEVLRRESDETLFSNPSTRRLKHAMMRRLKMISGLSREISFIVNTWNPESNCTCRKKNHSLFHWNTLTSPEIHKQTWMYCRRKIFDDYWERGWRKRIIRCMDNFHKIHFYWTKGNLTDIHGPGETNEGNKQPEDQTMYGQICGSVCLMHQNEKRGKSGLSRNINSIMPENYFLSSSLKLKMRNSRTSWKTLVERWKFPCQQQCLVLHQ